MPENTIASPCVRNCCLDKEDVCMGCFRHIDEITGWQAAPLQEKLLILKRCRQRKQDALARRAALLGKKEGES